MTDATARHLNTAACHVWFFQNGLVGALAVEHVRTIHQATVAQLQTAADVVDALNLTIARDAKAQGHAYRLECILDPGAAPRLKAYADSLEIR